MRKLIQIAVISGVAATVGWSADVEAGKTLYATKCRTCHGAQGQGNPAMAKALKVEIKDLGSPDVQKMTDAELKKSLTDGIGKMKPILGIAPADQDNLVALMRTFKK